MARDLGNGIEIAEETSEDSLGARHSGTVGGNPVVVRLVEADADGLRRLRRERSVLIGLSSRYVIPWREIVALPVEADAPPTIAFVSDPLSGPTLEEELAGGLTLTAPQAARLGADLALGLVALHAAGLVHGAIHPDLVRRDGEPGRGQTLPSARLSGVGVRSLAGGEFPRESEDVVALAGIVTAVLTASGVVEETLGAVLAELADPESGRTARDAATRLATTSTRLGSARTYLPPAPVVALPPARVVQPEPFVEPAPVVEPEPFVEPARVAAAPPVVEPAPIVEPEPITPAEPVVEPAPVAEPAPIIPPEPEPEPTPAPAPAPVVDDLPATAEPVGASPAELLPAEPRRRRARGALIAAVVVVVAAIAALLVAGHSGSGGGTRAIAVPTLSPSPVSQATPVLTQDLSSQAITAAQIGRAAAPLSGISGDSYNSLLQALYAYCDYYTPDVRTETGHSFVGYSSGIGINIYEDISTYTGTGPADLLAGLKQSISQCPVLMAKDDAGNVLGTFTITAAPALDKLPSSQVGLVYQRTDMVVPAVQAVFMQKGDHVIALLAQGRTAADLTAPLQRIAVKALANLPK